MSALKKLGSIGSLKLSKYLPKHCEAFEKESYRSYFDEKSLCSPSRFLYKNKVRVVKDVKSVKIENSIWESDQKFLFIQSQSINFTSNYIHARSVFICHDGFGDAPTINFERGLWSKPDFKVDHLWVPNTLDLLAFKNLEGKGIKKLYIYDPNLFNPTLNEIYQLENGQLDATCFNELFIYDFFKSGYDYSDDVLSSYNRCSPSCLESAVDKIDSIYDYYHYNQYGNEGGTYIEYINFPEYGSIDNLKLDAFIARHCIQFEDKYGQIKGKSYLCSDERFVNEHKYLLLKDLHSFKLSHNLKVYGDKICFIQAPVIDCSSAYKIEVRSLFICNDNGGFSPTFKSYCNFAVDNLWLPNNLDLNEFKNMYGEGVEKLFIYDPEIFNLTLDQIRKVDLGKLDPSYFGIEEYDFANPKSGYAYEYGSKNRCTPSKLEESVLAIDSQRIVDEIDALAKYYEDEFRDIGYGNPIYDGASGDGEGEFFG